MSFPIQIDATQVSYNQFVLDNVGYDGNYLQSLQLETGNHLLLIVTKGIEINFDINDRGTIEYNEKFDTFVSGRGTQKLDIQGFPVTFNTSNLSQPNLLLAGALGTDRGHGVINASSLTNPLKLVPGDYALQINGEPGFVFTIAPNGQFNFNPDYDAFLGGRDTSQLTFSGYTIEIDATQLSLDRSFGILGGTPYPNLDPKTVQSITLLPGTFSYEHPYPTDVVFSVTTAGIITCASKYRDALTIEGRKLTIVGFEIAIDATDIFGSCGLLASSQQVESIKSFRLLPTRIDEYALSYFGTNTYCFGLDTNGRIIYPSNFETSVSGGFLSGAGTSTLKIGGYPVEIDTLNWRNSSIFLQMGGNRTELFATAPSPHIVRLLPQFGGKSSPDRPPAIGPISLLVPATSSTPQTELDLSLDVNGNLFRLATYPDLTVTKEGRKTRLVFGKAPEPKPTLTVRGVVRQIGTQPLVGAIVRAFDRELRSETLLGETTTDLQGNYTIDYTSDRFQHPNKQNADLIVRVVSGTGEVLAASELILGAGSLQEVNLTVAARVGGSEWETIAQAVIPLLAGAQPIPDTSDFTDLPPEQLEDTDLDRLVRQTGLDREQLRLWILAVKAMKANAVLIDGDFPDSIDWIDALQSLYPRQPRWEVLEWMLFYGWFRQQPGNDADTVLNSATDTSIETLKQAIAQQQIADLNRVAIDRGAITALEVIRQALQRHRIDRALRPAAEGQPPSWGDVLGTMPNLLPDDKLRATAGVLLALEPIDVAERLRAAGLVDTEVRSVQRTMALRALAQNYLPVIRALQLPDPDADRARLRELANWELSAWTQLVSEYGFPAGTIGDDDDLKQRNYAESLARTIEQMHPSAWIADRINDDRFPIASEAKTDVQTFLAQNDSFQIGKTQVVNYFERSELVLDRIGNVEQLKSELMKVERMVDLAPNLEVSGKLLNMGMHSAYAIAQQSESSFVSQAIALHPELEPQARAIHQSAIAKAAMATAIATEYIRASRDNSFGIMRHRSDADGDLNDAASPSKEIANLQALFGNLDFCTCEHCSSIYSPAAYFVDLMKVLDNKTKVTVNNVESEIVPLDILLQKRPDLAEIDLTCDNTNISVPYIDLALEILENAVAPIGFLINNVPPGIVVVGQSEISSQLSNQIVPDSLKTKILEQGFTINSDVRVTTEQTNQRWSLRQAGLKVVIKTTPAIRLLSVELYPQTAGTTAELSAVPAFINPEPYNNQLRNAAHPWSLPFDYWWEETRIWLGQLKVDRVDLMESFIGNNRYLNIDIATEFLGFTQSEVKKITTHDTDPWLLWGFKSATNLGASIPDPIAGNSLPINDSTLWSDVLQQRASLVRHRAQLTQRELMNLVQLEFVQPRDPQNSLRLKLTGDECDASLMPIENLSVGSLKRIHAFVRLWRKLGWSMFDLDRATQAIAQPFTSADTIPLDERTFTNDFVVNIANIERLRQRLGLPIGILLNWYTPTLNTRSYVDFNDGEGRILPSPYESLFYDRAIARPKDAASELNNIAALFETIRSKMSPIAAALSTQPTEIETLLPKAIDTISLQEITQATQPNESIAVNISRFDETQPDRLRAVIELDIHEPVRGTGTFTINLQHADLPTDVNSAPSFEDIPITNLEDIPLDAIMPRSQPTIIDNNSTPQLLRFNYRSNKNLLRVVVTEVTGTEPQNPPRLKMGAKILLYPATVADDFNLANLSALSRYTSLAKSLQMSVRDLLLAIDLTGIAPFTSPAATLNFIERLQEIGTSGFSLVELDYLLRHRSLDRTTIVLSQSKAAAAIAEIRQGLQQIKQQQDLIPEEPNLSEAERVQNRAEKKKQLDRLFQQLLSLKLAAVVGVETAVADFLLKHLQYGSGNAAKSLLEIFIDPSFLTSKDAVTGAGSLRPQFQALELMYKSALIIDRLKIKQEQLDWLFGDTWPTLLRFSQLPLTENANSQLFFRWLDSIELLGLRDRLPNGIQVLNRIQKLLESNQISWDSCQNAVADSLDWDGSELKQLLSRDGLAFTGKDDFKQIQKLTQLADCLEVMRKLGATATLAIAWKQPLLGAKDAVAARQLVRSRYSQETWYQLAQPLQNKLRGMRRNALVNYLVHQKNVRDANDLFGIYLIDPEMGDCMMTTRILQASSTVQLFIHRCLIGLEPDVPASAIDKARWKWMKNYRVWEANRKVFLYPENWIEPELRDDKSPFFKELESELLQGDITSEKAEKALSSYLSKLEEVSRLEVLGMYRDTPVDTSGNLKYGLETIYVFARTYSTPYKYFYRQYHKLGIDPSDGYWTAWEKVDLDFDLEESDCLYPILFNKKLYLFWLSLVEKADEKLPDALPAPPPPPSLQTVSWQPSLPRKFWEVSLNWSTFEQGKWKSKSSYINQKLIYDKYRKNFFAWSESGIRQGVLIKFQKNYDSRYSPLPGQLNALESLTFDGYNIEARSYGDPVFVIAGSKRDIYQFFNLSQGVNSPIRAFGNQRSFNRVTWLHQDLSSFGQFSAPSQLNPGYINPNFGYGESMPFVLSDAQKRIIFVYPYFQAFLKVHAHDDIYYNYERQRIRCAAFYHPQVQRFQQLLKQSSVNDLLKLKIQKDIWEDGVDFLNSLVINPELIRSDSDLPEGNIDFSPNGAYSQYNWELFFHLPFTVATHLAKNQRFEEARQWFHYIFDPTDSSSDPEPKRFWHFLPFNKKAETSSIQKLAKILATPADELTKEEDGLTKEEKEELKKEKEDFEKQLKMWLQNPFKPHAVARWRNRAYMFSVVMKYLDNLIAWGDQLFRRDTRESLNEATQIYILAAQILGRRPESVPRRTRPQVRSFGNIRAGLDDLSNIQVAAENIISSAGIPASNGDKSEIPPILLFCIPDNPKILEYYETVADRLYKLRNCKNIDGVTRQLALFDPPIDPAILTRAAEQGLDLTDALNDLNAPLPLYRFNIMSQKATELCAEVKSMGAALLSALEKRDVEAMALLRSQHEIGLLQSQRQLKEYQIEEAKTNIEAIAKSLESAQTRMTYYVGLVSAIEDLKIPTGPVEPQAKRLISATLDTLGKAAGVLQVVVATINPLAASGYELLKQALSRAAEALDPSLAAQNGDTNKVPMIPAEKRQLDELKESHDLQQKAKDYQAVAQLLAKIPDVTLGIQGLASSPVVQAQIGGSLLSTIALAQANEVEYQSSEHAYRANLHSILAGYQRRAAEWVHQANLASKEIEQIAKQGLAAAIRLKMAAEELKIWDRQIENARSVDEFMRSKYTKKELYDWMVGQLSDLYIRSYQLAYDVAKRAEKTYRHELGLTDADSNFIQFGYWDNMKEGLLAGDRLYHSIKRMEVAYLEKNAREYEIIKHVSLLQLNPEALLKLRNTGRCEFSLPEELFDLDCPGHYFRRIKNVALSIPCVTGSYTSINCTLTLGNHYVRISTEPGDGYARKVSESSVDSRFRSYSNNIQSIVTSTGQNDSGLFETNLRDERYLPFEGAGVISAWTLQLPANPSERDPLQFDYDTISDVILHIRYTARKADELKKAAIANLKAQIAAAQANGSVRLFSIRHEFPTEWAQFQNAPDTAAIPLVLKLRSEHYPFWSQDNLKVIRRAKLFVKTTKAVEITYPPDGTGDRDILVKNSDYGNLWHGLLTKASTKPVSTETEKFTIYFNDKSMEDIWLAITWGQTD